MTCLTGLSAVVRRCVGHALSASAALPSRRVFSSYGIVRVSQPQKPTRHPDFADPAGSSAITLVKADSRGSGAANHAVPCEAVQYSYRSIPSWLGLIAPGLRLGALWIR